MADKDTEATVVGGVDTHKDFHVAAVVDKNNKVLGTRYFSTTRQGYRQMLAWNTPGAEKQVKRQLWQVNGYEWTTDYAGLTARPDAFISGAESLLSKENG